MKPYLIGRLTGAGLRIAGRMAGQALDEATTPAQVPASVAQPAGQAPARSHIAGQVAAPSTQSIARGVGGFLRPFRRVGSIVWLEITGAFFLLPVIAFAPNLWRMRADWQHGPNHNTFLITAGVVVVFLYLSVTSFWRARRK